MRLPARGQGQAKLSARDIIQTSGILANGRAYSSPLRLAADLGVAAAEPHLFDLPGRAGAVPDHRLEGGAGFVQRQGLHAMFDLGPKVAVVKAEARLGRHPQQRQPQPQHRHRVKDADHADRTFGVA